MKADTSESSGKGEREKLGKRRVRRVVRLKVGNFKINGRQIFCLRRPKNWQGGGRGRLRQRGEEKSTMKSDCVGAPHG